ncbi:chemoreceptor glutamine deamidase CheD [Orrella sp. JC864]|uniref:chemoreceptor glutamine deamidase CheD n=1 Tax=Orrella sp. JC864 TaxID=3120298 RepID=UPI0012BD5877
MPYQEALATRTYFDTAFDLPAVKVLPTEYYVSKDDIMISTVLGSCVSACIRDNQSGWAGMNHFMLPEGDPASPSSATMRYGAYAMETLINELLKAGASRARLEAKVFGGGAVLDAMRETNIGERNAAFVINYLRLEKIPVVAQDLGGPHARRINYFARTGQVLVRKLISQHRAESVIARRELAVARTVQAAAEGKG